MSLITRKSINHPDKNQSTTLRIKQQKLVNNNKQSAFLLIVLFNKDNR